MPEPRKQHLPFFKRLLVQLFLPVLLIGSATSALCVYYLSQPLERQLLSQYDNNLTLASALGLQVCDETFSYILELRLENDDKINRTLKNETFNKLAQLGDRFPYLQLHVVSPQGRVLNHQTNADERLWQGELAADMLDRVVELELGDSTVRAFVRSFPYWDWYVVSVIPQQDYRDLVRQAQRITYLSAGGVFVVVFVALLFVFLLFVNRPLQRLMRATEGVQKVDHIPENEIGRLMQSFNVMIDNLSNENCAVKSLVEKLRESEAMFRSQFEYGSIGISITDMLTGEVRVNDRLCEIVGYRREDLVALDWEEITLSQDLATELPLFERLIRGEIDHYHVDKRIIHESGELLSVHASISCSRGNDGGIRFLIASLLDMSARIAAESELQKSGRMLRLVLDTVPVRLFWKDLEGTYQGANRSFSHDAGLASPEEIVGKNDYELLFNAEAESYRNDDFAVMESGQAKLFYEEVQHRKDGSLGWLMTSKVPMLDDKGKVFGVLGAYHDITSQKLMELELQRFRRHLANIIDAMPSLLVAVDKELRVTQWNSTAASITGLAAEKILGQELCSTCSLFAGDREKIIHSLSSREVVTESDRVYERAEGTSHHTLTIYPLYQDGIEGAVIRLDDVTATHLLQEQLNHRNKMDAIGHLAGGVAHDFNNMLGGIIGAAEVLKTKIEPTPETDRFFAMIVETATRASGLTQKLLVFARRQPQVSATLDMHKVISDAVALLGQSIDKRVRIQVEEKALGATVVGDAAQLQNVIMNLGINAAHAMPNGGDLKISTETRWLDEASSRMNGSELHEGDYLYIQVRDSGCGIDPQILPHIFDPFYTTKKQGEGTGLGLAAVFGTLQQHHGAITVDSEPGSGTVFHLYLPLTGQQEMPVQEQQELIAGTGLVLIVDDEEVLRNTSQAQLEWLGYRVLLAQNGEEALEIYRQHWQEIELVLLDMIMPLMNGRDCFAALKQINPQVRVILCSGYSATEDIVGIREAGLAGVLSKPYTLAGLSKAVAQALGTT
jgi:PAS domain S-box-containing protein